MQCKRLVKTYVIGGISYTGLTLITALFVGLRTGTLQRILKKVRNVYRRRGLKWALLDSAAAAGVLVGITLLSGILWPVSAPMDLILYARKRQSRRAV